METKIVDKPWGSEEIWAITSKYVGKILHIDAHQKLSRQYHEVKDETIYVLSGQLILEIGKSDNIITKVLYRGDTYRITPNTIHRFIAAGKPTSLIEVSTPELDDVVRLEDDYGRKN